MVEAGAGQRLNATARARLTAALCAAVLLAGCAAFPVAEQPASEPPESGAGPALPPGLPPAPETLPEPPPEARPVPTPMPEPAPSYHPAGEALVEQARREADLGNEALAGATLERALRIDGGNPWIWIELGHLRLDAGQPAAAESMARKALSLASRDPAARAAAANLLQQAGSGR
jgi:tetratricopeptide (TPR) repeat protein